MMRTVAADDPVEAGIGKGEPLSATAHGMDIRKPTIGCGLIDNAEHRLGQIVGDDFGSDWRYSKARMACATAEIKYASIWSGCHDCSQQLKILTGGVYLAREIGLRLRSKALRNRPVVLHPCPPIVPS